MKSTFCRILAIVLLCVAGFAALQTAGAQSVAASLTKEQVLDRWAEAFGGRENLQNVRTIHQRGTIEARGMKGTYERWTTSRGELRMAVELSGAFRQVSIFDGQKGWALDSSGTPHELSGGSLRSVVSSAYEASDSFLFSGRIPGHIELTGEDANHEAYVLSLEPDGGNPITMYLDERTFLPLREETAGPMGNRTVRFSDWREFSGVKIPCVIQLTNGDPQSDIIITTEQVEINTPLAAELFAKPGDTAAPVRFAPGAHEAVIPVEVFLQRVYVPVRVNGGETAWFFLDSGAETSLVSREWAERTGLAAGARIQVGGSGAGSTSMGMAEHVVLTLPGVEVPLNTLAVSDFSSILPMIGHAWDGNLGYDVISRLVVRVDNEHQQITIYDPATFVADEHAVALPLTFLGNIPAVQAKILLPGGKAIDAQWVIDSGASGALHLATPFANANQVLQAMQKTVSATSVGAGGETKDVAGRIAGFQLGPYLLREPVVSFSTDLKEGLLASPMIGGLIGGEILQRFTVTFDYPHHRILLEPNSRFSDPFRKNASGLSVLAQGADFRRFEVDGVDQGSPAGTAGVRLGDILTSLDGHPATELNLDKIEDILQQAGRTVRLTISRNGKAVKVKFKLEESI
jgi:outer membrane lipoprotein-sorting protein